jgi:hypothetical protein
MILVMVFSITPKRTVHEILGCHGITAPYQHHKGKETSFNKDGFHCACEQQEFQTAFIAGIPALIDGPLIAYKKTINIGLIQSYHSTPGTLQLLRGPPAIG